MLPIATIMAAAVLTGILVAAPMLVYADDTETSTDQDVRQKNTGSGDSANFNCAENLIKAGVDEQACEFGNGGDGGMNGGGGGNGELVDICHVSASGNEIDLSLPPNAAEAHLEQHDGPPGAGPDYEGNCDGRTLT